MIFVVVGAAVLGAVLGVFLDRHTQRRALTRRQRSLEQRITVLAIADAKPGEALSCVACHHPIAKHLLAAAYHLRPCNVLHCECGLNREDAAKVAKEAVAAELYVLRYGPPLELDPRSLLEMRNKLDDH